ncbi:MAG: hypothetical protein IBX43_06290 [Campylobacterales bacterium]|nr:hypothetical protein [Campylobacterales bacterium]
MFILLPMDSDDVQEASLVALDDVKKWALLNIEEGQLVEVTHYDDRSEISEWVEALIVIDESQNVSEFLEEQMMVLIAHAQRNIDDIVEAYLFRELHEMLT